VGDDTRVWEAKVATLNQTLSESNSEIGALTAALTERTAAVAERDRQIADLKQAVRERERNISGQLKDTLHRIKTTEESRPWRVTAPYRAIGAFVRRGIGAFKGSQIITRALVANLLLPAAFVYYGGLWGVVRALRRQQQFFAPVIGNQAVIRDRLLHRARWYRRLVLVNFSLAIHIHQAGSFLRSMRDFILILIMQSEGRGGLRHRLITTIPNMLPRLQPTSVVVIADALTADLARRILVADCRIPRADVSAGERATVGILKDLCALGYEVVFLPNDMAPSLHEEAELQALGIKVITRDAGYQYATHYVAAHGHQFGAFYIIRVDVAEAILPVARQVAPNARVIFHAPDLCFLREMREAEFHHDDAARKRARMTRDREIAVMSRADRIVVVSPAEVPLLQAEMPGASVTVFPALYAPVKREPRGFAERHNIFFLGGFGHRPNIRAVHWFAAEVWPHLRAALPEVEFHILGAEAPDSVVKLGRLPGIKVVGFVRDLDSILETLRVGVAPLLYGAGIKGKVAVTLGAGIPCVCTDIAAEGMGIQDGVHARVESDPHRFAEAIISLYTDAVLWARLSKNGQSLVQEKFGDAPNRAALLNVLNQARALPLSLFCDYCKTAKPAGPPVPDAETDVDVSIIVPAYNQWHLTRACLTSVVQTSVGSGVCFELILADDGSTDETRSAAETFRGLRVVKTPQNSGFLRNCNNAASHARGRHILLLNNDTVVLPGWLAALYHTIEADPSIAIAGSKLLYPDGYIQEAGCGLLANGDGVSIGRWDDNYFPVGRDEPVFNIERETDYISGASILIRRAFWQSVGGFDERYQNAYCEDSDLAMEARFRGVRVVYQPASEVVHFEQQSYADSASTHYAFLQNQNKQLLLAKWGDALRKDHLLSSSWHILAAHGERSAPLAAISRRKSGKLNVLYFTPFPSHPSNHGNQATIQQFARRFQSFGHKVHFAVLKSNLFAKQDEQAMFNTWDTLDIVPNSHPLSSDGSAIPFDGWYEDGLGEHIRVLCARYDIDVVFCSYVFQSKLLEFVPFHVLKVIDTHDKMGDRYEMLRSNGQPLEFFSCTPQEEGAYLRRADVVVARRVEEAHYFDSVTGRNTATVIPYFEDPHYLDKDFHDWRWRWRWRRHVGIVASANRVNLAIVGECLEAIDRRLAGAPCPFVMHIAGQLKHMVPDLPAAKAAVFRKPWVRLHGFVPDIGKFYGEMDLVVSPVTMGTGINVKTVQAMAYGMPLLTTSCGSKGIETRDPMHCHADLDALTDSLMTIFKNPSELTRLAALSRDRYDRFYEAGMNAMRSLFRHQKLLSAKIDSPVDGICSAVIDGAKHAQNRIPARFPIGMRGPSELSGQRKAVEQ
jgi:GT2 family glycosyltransferase/glycosyltransferase involved in cell wall biosynthesis